MSTISFRALARSDYPLLQKWLSQPHVDRWWHQPLDCSGLEHKYGPRIDGTEPVHVFIIEDNARPIGWIQWYRWSDYPEHAALLKAGTGAAGIDLALGEMASIGKGIGPRAIRDFALQVMGAIPGITGVVADPEVANARSVRAFEKAGFIAAATVQIRRDNLWRQVMYLSLPAVME